MDFNAADFKTTQTYTGRELEPELGLYYYRARYYDPTTGRFLQKDPDPGKMMNPITFLSKYIYAGNNPIRFTDPTGKFFGFDDAAFLIYAGIAAAVGTLGQYYTGQIKSDQIGDRFLSNFVTIALTIVAGDLLFGYNNLQFLNNASLGVISPIAFEAGVRVYAYNGILDIANNAFGADLRPGLAVAAFLFYPDQKRNFEDAVFILPR